MSGAHGLSAKAAAVSRPAGYASRPETESLPPIPVWLVASRWVLAAPQFAALYGVHRTAAIVLFAVHVAGGAPRYALRALFAYPIAVGKWWLKSDLAIANPSDRQVPRALNIWKHAAGVAVMLGALAIPVGLAVVALPMILSAESASRAQSRANAGLDAYSSGQMAAAIKELDEAIDLNPGLASAYVARAAVHGSLGDAELALSDASAAIGLDPSLAGAYVNRASAYLQLKNYAEALSDANTAIDLDANFAEAYVQRANAYLGLGKYQDALSSSERAIEVNSSLVPAQIVRGLAHSALGESQHAIDDWVAALSLTNDPNTTAQIDALINKVAEPH